MYKDMNNVVRKPRTIPLKAVIIVIIVTILLSSLFTWVIAQSTMSFSTVYESGSGIDTADYVFFRDGSTIIVKNGTTGEIELSTSNASYAIDSFIYDKISIHFKSGVYLIDSTISVDQRVTFWGEGNGTELKLTSNVNMFNVTADEVRFYELTMNGDTYNGSCIYIDTQMNCRIQRCRIWRFRGTGIHIAGQGNHWITDNRITVCERGIWLAYCSDNFIANNDIGATIYSGILVGGGHHVITGNRIYTCGYYWATDSSRHAYAAIYLYQARHLHVVNNQVTYNGGGGIQLVNSNFTIIQGNLCYDNDVAGVTRGGIYLYESFNNSVNNNFCLNENGGYLTQLAGINEDATDGGCDYNMFVGNFAYNNTNVNIRVTGTNSECHSSRNGSTWVT